MAKSSMQTSRPFINSVYDEMLQQNREKGKKNLVSSSSTATAQKKSVMKGNQSLT